MRPCSTPRRADHGPAGLEKIRRSGMKIIFEWMLLAALLSACTPGSAGAALTEPPPATQPSAGPTPDVPTVDATPALPDTPTPPAPPSTAAPTPPPTPTPPQASPTACPPDLCTYRGALVFRPPILPPGNAEFDRSYRFGSTQSGLRDPHHGVEFLNPYGTPVAAAAAGVVVVAGTDLEPTSAHGVWPITFYGPYSNFYGNLVVIEHAPSAELIADLMAAGILSDAPDPAAAPFMLYTLYGHLSEIEVVSGQTVAAGEIIGRVGQAGIATGSHLHFEVRLGENAYAAARNPELWLASIATPAETPTGAIAGRFVDSFANTLEISSIVIEHLPEGPNGAAGERITVGTYEEKALTGLPPWYESFAVGSLAPGWYRINFPMGGLRRELIQVFPGMVTVVTFRP